MLRLVYSTLGCPNWSLEQAADAAVAWGYVGLEIRMLDGEIIPANLPPGRRQAVKRVMAERDLVIAALGASTRFSASDPAERAANEAELVRYLELASDLESPMVRTFGGNVEAGQSLEQTIAWVAESLHRVASAAERLGVTILLETHDAFCRAAELTPVLRQVNSPAVQAVWDIHHPFRMGESIAETWALLKPYTRHVHVKDARRRADGGWQLVLLGEGDVPAREVVRFLVDEGYRGYLSAEWEKKWHPEIEEPEIALPQHAEVLRRWLTEDGAA